jgi:cyclophilin family peptidyl-prolyl cis-trans isomerase
MDTVCRSMVNEEKRQRHKTGHRSRVEAARLAEEQRRRRRRLITGAVVIVAIVGVFIAVTVTSGDDEKDAGSTTTGSSTTVSTPSVTAPPPGEAIDGATPCPAADGSAARTTAFAEAPPTCIDDTKTYTAKVTTSEGDITIDLDTENAPISVNNFVVLSRYHYFDGLPFHRVVPGFVDQTGSSGVPDIGSGGPGYDLPAEPPTRDYAAGDVAMAQGGGTNSGSQFFFTIDPASLQGGTYPIFGKVSEGQDVVQAINDLGNGDGPPTKSVTIDSVTITES